jgi:hypothetical protein
LPDGQVVPFRLTAVFHREGQAWRMVQAHFSVGVPNERLGQQPLRHDDTMTSR